MACNELPSNVDPSSGFFRRLIIIPFDAVFSEAKGNVDYDIGKKLQEEKSGILNRIIEGYDRLTGQGRFTQSKDVKEMIEEYRSNSDSVTEWMLEKTIKLKESESFIRSKDLYSDYLLWCDQLRIKYPKGHIAFSQRVGSVLGRKAVTKRINNLTVRGFEGVGVIDSKYSGVNF